MFQCKPGDLLIQNSKIIGFLIEVQREKNLMKFYRTMSKNPNQVKRSEGVSDSSSSSSRDNFGKSDKQKKSARKFDRT